MTRRATAANDRAGTGRAAAIPVLLYHAVGDSCRPGLDRWTLTSRMFARHLESIAASGRTPLTISDLARGLRGERSLPERAVVVTFDDGYDDTLPAVEALVAASLAATVYVTSSAIGAPGMLSARDVRNLAEMAPAVELGAHGVTHRRLDELPLADVVSELAESRRAIENVAQRPCSTFAYPHGNHDRRVAREVGVAGYCSAAAVKNRLSHAGDDPYAIARLTIDAATPLGAVERALAGDGRLVERGEALRTRAYRTTRRIRRALAVRDER